METPNTAQMMPIPGRQLDTTLKKIPMVVTQLAMEPAVLP